MQEILSTEELESLLGSHIKTLRLQKNLARQTLCQQAGVSVSALRHLESGNGATVKTLVRVLRALDKENWIFGLAPQISINPLHMVKNNQNRQRASRTPKVNSQKVKI